MIYVVEYVVVKLNARGLIGESTLVNKNYTIEFVAINDSVENVPRGNLLNVGNVNCEMLGLTPLIRWGKRDIDTLPVGVDGKQGSVGREQCYAWLEGIVIVYKHHCRGDYYEDVHESYNEECYIDHCTHDR